MLRRETIVNTPLIIVKFICASQVPEADRHCRFLSFAIHAVSASITLPAEKLPKCETRDTRLREGGRGRGGERRAHRLYPGTDSIAHSFTFIAAVHCIKCAARRANGKRGFTTS